jgi:polyisoprenoid-binding protein YceI
MKNIQKITLALLVIIGINYSNAQTKNIVASKSNINWLGKKVTGEHGGTINIKEGNLIFKGNNLTGGTVIVDMTSMVATDLKPGQGKENLEGHLKSADFFGTEKYPTSKIVFKKVVSKGKNTYTVSADLSIKEKTNPVTFDIIINGNKATTALKVDRTKFDIKYGSGSFFDNLGDKAISDDFELNVTLQF